MHSRYITVSVKRRAAYNSNARKPMDDSLCVPYLVCWGSVYDTHGIRTQRFSRSSSTCQAPRHFRRLQVSLRPQLPVSTLIPFIYPFPRQLIALHKLLPSKWSSVVKTGWPTKCRVAKKDRYIKGVKVRKKISKRIQSRGGETLFFSVLG